MVSSFHSSNCIVTQQKRNTILPEFKLKAVLCMLTAALRCTIQILGNFMLWFERFTYKIPRVIKDTAYTGSEIPRVIKDTAYTGSEIPRVIKDTAYTGSEIPRVIKDTEGQSGRHVREMARCQPLHCPANCVAGMYTACGVPHIVCRWKCCTLLF